MSLNINIYVLCAKYVNVLMYIHARTCRHIPYSFIIIQFCFNCACDDRVYDLIKIDLPKKFFAFCHKKFILMQMTAWLWSISVVGNLFYVMTNLEGKRLSKLHTVYDLRHFQKKFCSLVCLGTPVGHHCIYMMGIKNYHKLINISNTQTHRLMIDH